MDASPYRIDTETWQRLLTELGVDARSSAPRAASPRHARRASSEASDDDTPREPWAIALRRAGRLGPALGDGRWAVLCPQDERHTNPDGSAEAAGGSCVLLPAGEGRLFGRPHCSHAHCAGLTLADWIHCVGAVVYADSIAEARGWRVARGYVMTPWGVFEARRKPLALPKVDAPDAAEPALAADAPAEGGELGAVVAAEEPFQWAPGDALCNFSARLALDVTEHAQGGEKRAFEISGFVGGRAYTIRVAAEDFASLGWVARQLGGEAVIEPGRDTKDRLRAALQHLSLPIARKDVFAIVGWREVAGRLVYLHRGGAIGADGAVPSVEVGLDEALEDFELPAPLVGAELRAGVEACAELFLLSASEVAVAVFGAVWRAPLGPSPLTVYINGAQETGKSYVAGLAQAHFGARWNGDHLPASLKNATAASVNKLRAVAGDCLFVCDDYVLRGTQKDAELADRVDLIVRAQYSGSARRALTAAGDLAKGDAAPRSLLVLTGEALPPGHSLRTRMVVAELERPMPEETGLRAARDRAAAGVYAGAMSGYLRWLAARLPAVRAGLRDRTHRVVEKLHDGKREHRALALLAEVGVGVGMFLEFATEVGVSPELVARVRAASWAALCSLRAQQRVQSAEQDPALRFLGLVSSALRGHRAHVTAPDGTAPVDPHLWGWTVKPPIEPKRAGDEPIEQPPTPNGDCIGFAEGRFVWLNGPLALATAVRLARESGDPLPLLARDLGRKLFEAKLLAKHGAATGQESYNHRKKFRGRILHGLCIDVETLEGVGTDTAVTGASVTENPN